MHDKLSVHCAYFIAKILFLSKTRWEIRILVYLRTDLMFNSELLMYILSITPLHTIL